LVKKITIMASPSSDYGNGVASDAMNTGHTAINSFDPTSTANGQKTSVINGLGSTLGGQTDNYIKKYADTVAANPTVTDLYTTGNNMYNVPGLAKTANYLQNEVTNAIPTGYRGARGFDIGDTAVQNGIASKLAYTLPQSNAATNNLNTAEGFAKNFVEAGQLQNAQNLLPIQAQAPLELQKQAAEATGWNNAAQSEFEGLIEKMKAGVTLSTAEMERANVLAQMETSYQNAITSANATVNAAKIAQQFQTVGPGQNLVNTFSNTIMNPSTVNRTGFASYG
jgi:hypothetical protein